MCFNFCRCKNVENYGSFSSLKAPGNSSSLSGSKANFRNNSSRNRTPFHKRYIKLFDNFSRGNSHKESLIFMYESRSDSSLSKSKDRYSSNQPTSSKFNIRFVIFALFSFCLHLYHLSLYLISFGYEYSGLRLSSYYKKKTKENCTKNNNNTNCT